MTFTATFHKLLHGTSFAFRPTTDL